MDMENLIEQLNRYFEGETLPRGTALDAATALSTLQAENAQLRADLEYEREHADAYYEECGQWEAENEKLRAELEQVKRERAAAVDCIYQIEDDLDRGSDNDWAREHISEWESQKED